MASDSVANRRHGCSSATSRSSTRPFLLIVRTGRIVTASSFYRTRRRVPSDTRSFQHIARFVLGNYGGPVHSYGRRLPGFGSLLRPEGLTGPLNLPAPGRRQTLYVVLSTSQSPVFLVNSRYPLVSATASSSGSESLHQLRHTFSPKLRCQFAEFLNQSSLKRLGILCPPTCVGLRYGHQTPSLRGFSRKHGITDFASRSSRRHVSALNGGADLPTPPAYTLEPGCPTPGSATLLRPPFGRTDAWWYGNINPFSIAYGFRPRLRDRLTLSRLALLRNP